MRGPSLFLQEFLLGFVLMKFLLVTFLFSMALPANAAVVFMYHRFGEGASPSTNVTLEQFEAQLDYLEHEGFKVWPLPKLVTHLKQREPIPDKVVAITIDDAYESVFQHAFPMLQERGMPFTVFVATDPVDDKLPGYMDWEQLRALQAAGVTIANHGASHDYLVRRDSGESETEWAQRVREDTVRGQARLQEELGKDVNEAPRLYAYPFGEYSIEMMRMLEQMGYAAFGQHSGPAAIHDDLRALPRFPVNERYGDIADYSLKANTLPFPVLDAVPVDPVVNGSEAPVLELKFGESSARIAALTCYLGGGSMRVTWVSEKERHARISTNAPLPKGRSRYNCTAPHQSLNRWYWYSHPWIRVD